MAKSRPACSTRMLEADCDLVSDNSHDICLVRGSRSLFNIALVFHGKLPEHRAGRAPAGAVRVSSSNAVVVNPRTSQNSKKASDWATSASGASVGGRGTSEWEAGCLSGRTATDHVSVRSELHTLALQPPFLVCRMTVLSLLRAFRCSPHPR